MRQNDGFSMVELLVALATGLFLLAGVMGIFTSSLSSQGSTLKMTRLNQELRNTMDLMAREIRRSGYWHMAADAASPPGDLIPNDFTGANIDFTSATGTPFSAFGSGIVDLYIINGAGGVAIPDNYSNGELVRADIEFNFPSTDPIDEGSWMILNPFTYPNDDIVISGSCIIYAYDVNDSGDALNDRTSVTNDEKFGFRLNSGIVQMHNQSGSAPNCSNNTGWEDLTSDSITISDLTFSDANNECINLTDNPSDCGTVTPDTGDILLKIRQIDISLTGQLVSDSTVQRTFTETVRVRNDQMVVFNVP